MKNLAFLSAFALASFLIAGCSQKTPEVEVMSDAQEQVGSTISNGNDVSNTDQNDMSSVVNYLNSNLETIYFNFDKFNIKPDMQAPLSKDAGLLASDKSHGVSVRLEGNCDEWGSDEYNYALGLKRAKTVKDSLVAQGVNVLRLSVVSYGKSNPVCTEKTKACDAKNRRVNFKILP